MYFVLLTQYITYCILVAHMSFFCSHEYLEVKNHVTFILVKSRHIYILFINDELKQTFQVMGEFRFQMPQSRACPCAYSIFCLVYSQAGNICWYCSQKLMSIGLISRLHKPSPSLKLPLNGIHCTSMAEDIRVSKEIQQMCPLFRKLTI